MSVTNNLHSTARYATTAPAVAVRGAAAPGRATDAKVGKLGHMLGKLVATLTGNSFKKRMHQLHLNEARQNTWGNKLFGKGLLVQAKNVASADMFRSDSKGVGKLHKIDQFVQATLNPAASFSASIKQDKLKGVYDSGGFCFGASLEMASKGLKRVHNGDFKGALIEAANKFSKGATAAAVANQFVYQQSYSSAKAEVQQQAEVRSDARFRIDDLAVELSAKHGLTALKENLSTAVKTIALATAEQRDAIVMGGALPSGETFKGSCPSEHLALFLVAAFENTAPADIIKGNYPKDDIIEEMQLILSDERAADPAVPNMSAADLGKVLDIFAFQFDKSLHQSGGAGVAADGAKESYKHLSEEIANDKNYNFKAKQAVAEARGLSLDNHVMQASDQSDQEFLRGFDNKPDGFYGLSLLADDGPDGGFHFVLLAKQAGQSYLWDANLGLVELRRDEPPSAQLERYLGDAYQLDNGGTHKMKLVDITSKQDDRNSDVELINKSMKNNMMMTLNNDYKGIKV